MVSTLAFFTDHQNSNSAEILSYMKKYLKIMKLTEK